MLAALTRALAVVGSSIADLGVTTAKLAAKAVTTAKIDDGAVLNAQVGAEAAIVVTKLEGLADGEIIVGTDGTGANNDKVTVTGDVTMAKTGVVTLNAAHAEQLVYVPITNLGAGDDIANLPLFAHPRANTLQSIGILTSGSPAGVDDDNTVVIAVKNANGDTIVTQTYNTGTQPPDGDFADLGALDGDYTGLAAGEAATLSVTQGATANMPAFTLVITTVPTNAA